MAEAFVTLFPEGTEEQFNTLIEAMGTGHTDQPERILFAAGPSDAGWNIVQVWDDPAGLERLSEKHLRPAMARIGDRGFPKPPTMLPLRGAPPHRPGRQGDGLTLRSDAAGAGPRMVGARPHVRGSSHVAHGCWPRLLQSPEIRRATRRRGRRAARRPGSRP